MRELKKLFKSFEYAFEGIRFCVKSERNLRIHLTAIFYVLFFVCITSIHSFELISLLICFAMVISAELLNTSIEVLCDKESTGYNYFIKRAKDIAAAAVLVCAIFCIAVGLIIFIPKLNLIYQNFSIFHALFLTISIPISLIFIFKGEIKWILIKPQ